MVLILLLFLAKLNLPFQIILPLIDVIPSFPSTSLTTLSYYQVSSQLDRDSQGLVPKALFSFCTYFLGSPSQAPGQ